MLELSKEAFRFVYLCVISWEISGNSQSIPSVCHSFLPLKQLSCFLYNVTEWFRLAVKKTFDLFSMSGKALYHKELFLNKANTTWYPLTPLTFYNLTSECKLSILCSIHFLRCWQGEFVQQSRASLVGDHFLYSRNLNVWFGYNIVRRN